MKARALATSLLALSLVGCATATSTYTQDGRAGYTINCSGAANTWDKCYAKAGDLCGARGYDVLDKSGDTGSTIAGNQFGVYGGTVVTRSLVIACKAPSTTQ